MNQIISGTVINILAVGLTGYLNRQLFFQQGAQQLQSAGTLSRMPIPLLSDHAAHSAASSINRPSPLPGD